MHKLKSLMANPFNSILDLANQVSKIENEDLRILTIQKITWGDKWRLYTPKHIIDKFDRGEL